MKRASAAILACLLLVGCDSNDHASSNTDLAQYYQSFRVGNPFTPMHGATLVESNSDYDKWMIHDDLKDGEHAEIEAYFVTVSNGKIVTVYAKTKYN